MAISDTLINTLFDGRYRILRKLGAGGMANVYLAEDQELGRRVAIKILNDRHANDDSFIERFRREAKNAAGLSHPNIVSIYDRGEAEGTYYIAMEHLDGRTLKELIVARGPAPPHIAVDYARQILAALRFAHRNGIVHRDIKPHNVLVDAEGRVKVTDFGIARAGASQMTEVGSIIGTAQYLSPEQAKGAPVDPRSDLYSLGVVLYELLTGTVPFSGDSPVEIAMKHLSAKPEPPSERRADIPQELDLVVVRALAKEPEQRYGGAEEMDADLARIARGAHVSRQTTDAATAIISSPASMPTTITRVAAESATVPTRQAPVYAYDQPIVRRQRPLWPWLLALFLVAGALAGGWYVYDQIQAELAESKPVAVPDVEGTRRILAAPRIRAEGLEPRVTYQFSDTVQVGFVIDQQPDAGNRIDRGNIVSLFVSLGRERIRVPDVRGRSVTDAVAALTEAGLEANPVEINSEKPEDTVIAQEPRPGRKIPKGETVRINISAGPKPITVPAIEGQPFETASSILQGEGFSVARRDVNSDQPAGSVVEQAPAGNSTAPRGSTVRISVSKGPQTAPVPDVTSVDRPAAVQTIENSGFKVRVVREDTDEEAFDDVVLTQSPEGGTRAKPGTRVTVRVGRFVAPPPTTTEEEEPPPPPPPTTTTGDEPPPPTTTVPPPPPTVTTDPTLTETVPIP